MSVRADGGDSTIEGQLAHYDSILLRYPDLKGSVRIIVQGVKTTEDMNTVITWAKRNGILTSDIILGVS